jgi:hypothetical protein
VWHSSFLSEIITITTRATTLINDQSLAIMRISTLIAGAALVTGITASPLTDPRAVPAPPSVFAAETSQLDGPDLKLAPEPNPKHRQRPQIVVGPDGQHYEVTFFIDETPIIFQVPIHTVDGVRADLDQRDIEAAITPEQLIAALTDGSIELPELPEDEEQIEEDLELIEFLIENGE